MDGGALSGEWLANVRFCGGIHREAVQKGYLAEGVSSAISFPTGGGKSTLAELKIANAFFAKEGVFLAPTHALVGQTTVHSSAPFKPLTFSVTLMRI